MIITFRKKAIFTFLILIFGFSIFFAQDSLNYEYNSIAMSHFINGLFYYKAGNTDTAIREFKKAVENDPTQPAFYNMLVECYINNSDLQNLIPVLEKSIELDIKNKRNADMLLKLYIGLKKYDKVENHLEFLIENFRKDSSYKVQYIEMLILNGNKEKADRFVKKYIIEDELDNKSLKLLTRLYIKYDIDYIIDVLNEGLKYNSDNPYYHFNLGILYKEKNNIDNALKYYLQAKSIIPMDSEVVRYIANIYLEKEQYDKLIETVDIEDEFFDLKLEMAGKLIQNRQDIYAMKLLNDLLSSDVENKRVYLLSGIVMFNKGDYDKSIDFVNKYVEIDSSNYYPFYIIGMAYFQKNDYDNAVASLKRAVNLNSDDLNSMVLIADIYYTLKQYNLAEEYYIKALEIDSNSDIALNNYSYMLAEMGKKLDFALQMSKKAVEMQPDNDSYLDTLGWIYYKMNKYEQALKYIKKASEKKGTSADIYEHLGDVYYKLGDIDKAKRFWKISYNMDSSKKELLDKIENE